MRVPTITQAVTDELRRRIVHGELGPGARINYNEVAQELGVSPTPVRDAAQRLADDGLVELSPRRSACVRQLTLQDAREMTMLREALEALAFRIVAPHITDDDLARLRELHQANYEACVEGDYTAAVEADTAFHHHVVRRTGNERLMDFLRRLSVLRAALRISLYKMKASVLSRTRDDHLALIDALATRDSDIAEAAIRKHVRTTHQEFVEWTQGAAAQPAPAVAVTEAASVSAPEGRWE